MGEWIACKDRQPEVNGKYLVTWNSISEEDGNVYPILAVIEWEEGWNCYKSPMDGTIVRAHELKDVVAWMELPAPYKEVE